MVELMQLFGGFSKRLEREGEREKRREKEKRRETGALFPLKLAGQHGFGGSADLALRRLLPTVTCRVR